MNKQSYQLYMDYSLIEDVLRGKFPIFKLNKVLKIK